MEEVLFNCFSMFSHNVASIQKLFVHSKSWMCLIIFFLSALIMKCFNFVLFIVMLVTKHKSYRLKHDYFVHADLRKCLGDVWMECFTGMSKSPGVRFMRRTVPPLYLVNLQTWKYQWEYICYVVIMHLVTINYTLRCKSLRSLVFIILI